MGFGEHINLRFSSMSAPGLVCIAAHPIPKGISHLDLFEGVLSQEG
jgi:hypothetical protein